MLTIIIPTFNEAGRIGNLIRQLEDQVGVEIEVIIADGGSSDETIKITQQTSALTVTTDKGRGVQMNAGAAAAKGEYLLFLHADSRLTSSSQLSSAVQQISRQAGYVAGHFPMTFDTQATTGNSALRYFEEKTKLNRPGTWNGDQGLMISTRTFALTGGFSEKLPFLEDQDFGQRFGELGSFITFEHLLVTSARRFEQEGVSERIILNTLIMAMFHLSLHDFFTQTVGIYKSDHQTDQFSLPPYFKAVQHRLFANGFIHGIRRVFSIGRYSIRNLWQLFFFFGVRWGDTEKMLDRADKVARPILDNPFGHMLGMLFVTGWFYLTWLRFVIHQDR